MFRYKKKISAALLAGLLLLSGCTANNDRGDTPDANVGEAVTLTLGIWQGNDQEQAALDEVLANIKEQHNITVEKKIYTDYETQLKTDIAGKVAPDVFYLEAFIAPEIIDSGAVAPINDTTKQQANIADFYPSFIDAFSQDGELYGFPKDFSALATFYNETMLADAGYTADDIPDALEDWPAFLEELQSKLPAGVSALSVNQELPRWMSVLEASGSEVTKEDGTANLEDPALVQAVDFVGAMYQGGYLKTPKELGNDWVGDSLGAGKAAIALEGNWMIGHLNNNFSSMKYGTKEMPTYQDKNNTLSFTVAYAVNANGSNLDAANLLAHYLTDPDNMKSWCAGAGVMPTRASVSEELNLAADPLQASIINGAEYATPWQRGMTLSIINREFNNWFPKVCNGEMTGAQAMAEAAKTADNDIRNLMQ